MESEMKVKDLIKELQKYDGELTVCIYVPGDDAGFWEVKNAEQIKEDKYADTDETYLKITIY
jgi:hypothetical protein